MNGRVSIGSRRGTPVARDRARSTSQRWWSSVPLFGAGGVAVVAGGLTAAVTGPTGFAHGSWVAAFLVLVVGVGQIGLGAGQAHLAPTEPTIGATAVIAALWNAGCAVVISGTLLARPLVVSIGSAALCAALVMSMVAVRGQERSSRLLLLYRALLVVLAVSIPIGTALSWARH